MTIFLGALTHTSFCQITQVKQGWVWLVLILQQSQSGYSEKESLREKGVHAPLVPAPYCGFTG